jgi:hypothetical protein
MPRFHFVAVVTSVQLFFQKGNESAKPENVQKHLTARRAKKIRKARQGTLLPLAPFAAFLSDLSG